MSNPRSISELNQLLLTPEPFGNYNLSTESLPRSPMGLAFSPDNLHVPDTITEAPPDYFSSTTATSATPTPSECTSKLSSNSLLSRFSRWRLEHGAGTQPIAEAEKSRMKATMSTLFSGRKENAAIIDRTLDKKENSLFLPAAGTKRRRLTRKTPSTQISPPILPPTPPTLSTEAEHVIQMTKLYNERHRGEVRRSRSFSGFKGGMQWDDIVAAVSKEELAKDAALRRGVGTLKWKKAGMETVNKDSGHDDGISLRF
ncbi:hypothetical protein VNI00_008139 [Paramarasmius palmivorus]|uniref:Uncharacterized protein n=1 Tax=Paramarasmius palmivorus TaxID=297713 RepID=A0AAW0CXG8_9AGAR